VFPNHNGTSPPWRHQLSPALLDDELRLHFLDELALLLLMNFLWLGVGGEGAGGEVLFMNPFCLFLWPFVFSDL
jgi:hypothetical protein